MRIRVMWLACVKLQDTNLIKKSRCPHLLEMPVKPRSKCRCPHLLEMPINHCTISRVSRIPNSLIHFIFKYRPVVNQRDKITRVVSPQICRSYCSEDQTKVSLAVIDGIKIDMGSNTRNIVIIWQIGSMLTGTITLENGHAVCSIIM